MLEYSPTRATTDGGMECVGLNESCPIIPRSGGVTGVGLMEFTGLADGRIFPFVARDLIVPMGARPVPFMEICAHIAEAFWKHIQSVVLN